MGWDVTFIPYGELKPVASLYVRFVTRLVLASVFWRYSELRLAVKRHVHEAHGLGLCRYMLGKVARLTSNLFACQAQEHTRPFGEKVLFSTPNR